ncbi:nose resistant to fluoxetine protein 6, partial [Caerostris extrusa]
MISKEAFQRNAFAEVFRFTFGSARSFRAQLMIENIGTSFINMHLITLWDLMASDDSRLILFHWVSIVVKMEEQSQLIYIKWSFSCVSFVGCSCIIWYSCGCLATFENTELKDEQKDKFIEFFLAFSLYSNTKKLLKTEKHNGSEITAINGMYVLGTVLGGLLLVYPRFRRGTKNVEINMMKIIIRRYIRLCPSLLFILGVIVILPLVGSGPVWADIFDKAADNTRKWWWTYVLMFNNFLAVKDQNFLYLWFIPCLMQISIIGAILVWMLAKSPKVGICIIIATGVACNIALEYFEETIYTAPLSHVFSYGIGMLLGYFMAKNPTLKFSKVHVVLGWIAALILMVGVQLIAYAGKDGMDPNPVLAGGLCCNAQDGLLYRPSMDNIGLHSWLWG